MGPDGAVNIVFRNELQRRRRSRRAPRRARAGLPREVREPVEGGRARLHRRGRSSPRRRGRRSSTRSRCSRPSATPTRRRSTETFRSNPEPHLVQEDPDRKPGRDRRARHPRRARARHQGRRHLQRRRPRRAARALRRRGLPLRRAAARRVVPARSTSIIEIAKKSGAEAIHPGYGFLSERGAFVDAVEKAGLVFIGPQRRRDAPDGRQGHRAPDHGEGGRADRAGHHRAPHRRAGARRGSKKVGPPVMIKAAAGGGGKGMRLVRDVKDVLPERRARAQRGQGLVRRRLRSTSRSSSRSRATSRSRCWPTRTATSSTSSSASARSSADTRR